MHCTPRQLNNPPLQNICLLSIRLTCNVTSHLKARVSSGSSNRNSIRTQRLVNLFRSAIIVVQAVKSEIRERVREIVIRKRERLRKHDACGHGPLVLLYRGGAGRHELGVDVCGGNSDCCRRVGSYDCLCYGAGTASVIMDYGAARYRRDQFQELRRDRLANIALEFDEVRCFVLNYLLLA